MVVQELQLAGDDVAEAEWYRVVQVASLLPLLGIERDLFRCSHLVEEVELEPAVVGCSVVVPLFPATPLQSRQVHHEAGAASWCHWSWDPSASPTSASSVSPSQELSAEPSLVPTLEPSATPSYQPSWMPRAVPSWDPSASPTSAPNVSPSQRGA